MDNVLIVVADLEAAKVFFAELGMELEGETQLEGPWVDRTVGLDDVVARLRSHGAELLGEITQYEDIYRSASFVALRASSSDLPSSSADGPSRPPCDRSARRTRKRG